MIVVCDYYIDTDTTTPYYETVTTESNYDYYYTRVNSANRAKVTKALVKPNPVYEMNFRDSAIDKGCCREKVKNCCLPLPDT